MNLLVTLRAGELQTVATNQLIRLEAQYAYTVLHLANGKRLVACKNLQHFAEQFTDRGMAFMRVHRSHLVNLEHVTGLQREGNSLWSVELSHDNRVPVAKGRWEQVKALLNQHFVKV